MARSFIDPSLVALATQPAAPPWDWNPGATFVTAFNNAQENKRAQEKMALEMELSEILLPAKKAEAEFNIKKLGYDSQLLEKIYQTKSAALDASYRGITSAVTGGGGGNSSAGRSPSDGPYQSRFGFGSGLSRAPQTASVKPTWKVVEPATQGP